MRITTLFVTTVIAIILSAPLPGCMQRSNTKQAPTQTERAPEDKTKTSDTFTIYFYREANYKGLGRIHLLKIDDIELGPIEANNYYRAELWPGEYHMAVFLPVENFLGNISPAANISTRLVIKATDAPGVGIFKYSDGGGIYRVRPGGQQAVNTLTDQRVLSASLSAREMAQVKFLYDGRYDGPSMLGKAHGEGTLAWNDGSVFKGRFEYGEPTTEGQFFSPGKPVYMGPNKKGRPVGPGVWMTSDRLIVYAGNFLDERPHGVGFRSGSKGPEFCEYDNGIETTKPFHQLVLESIELEDKNHILTNIGNPYFADWTSTGAITQPTTDEQFVDEDRSVIGAYGLFSETRDERNWMKQNEIDYKIRQRIEKKQVWCDNEALLGRRLCVCAPFADDFDDWNSCESK